MKYFDFIKKRVFYWFSAFLVSMLLFITIILFESSLIYSSVVRESVSEVYSTIGGIRNETQGFVKTDTGYVFVKPSFEHRLGLFFRTIGIIYFNNALLNTLYTIPFTGTAIYVSSLVHTSLVSKYISMEFRNNWFQNIVETVILSPHTYLEILAYSITIVESTYIGLMYLKSFARKKWIINEKNIAYSLLSIGLTYIILLIASVVESIIILQT